MKSKQYKYQQVKEAILDQLASGVLKKDDRIPSEKELARQWEMSPLTVGKALSQMEKEGYLVRKVGDGTYVRTLNPRDAAEGETKPERAKYIAVLVNNMTFGIIPHIIHQIEKQFTQLGYHILIKDLHHSVKNTLHILKTIKEDDICGIIFSPIFSLLYEYDNAEIYQALEKFNKPIVLFNSYMKDLDCNFVVTDNRQGGFDAADHLIQRGHKHIGLVWSFRDSSSRDRIEGYVAAMEEHGLFFDERYVIRCSYDETVINKGVNPCLEGLDKLFALPKPPTAIFALDDYLAHFTRLYLQEKGKEVPRDVSLIGFDDFLPSQITTVRQDVEGLATNTVNLFTELLKGRTPERKGILVPTTLVIRETTRSSPRQALVD